MQSDEQEILDLKKKIHSVEASLKELERKYNKKNVPFRSVTRSATVENFTCEQAITETGALFGIHYGKKPETRNTH